MSEAVKKHRPEFRNIHVFKDLPHYRLPPGGMVSILHRISGFLLFLLLPFVLYLLEKSLMSELSFAHFKGIASHWFVKLIILTLAWAYLHHFCAGIRHLIMDAHIGLSKGGSRKTAISVFAVSLPLTLLVALKLFGVF
jgi:succinate dehydrogenase / fumarate reductase cytochrome b subunit